MSGSILQLTIRTLFQKFTVWAMLYVLISCSQNKQNEENKKELEGVYKDSLKTKVLPATTTVHTDSSYSQTPVNQPGSTAPEGSAIASTLGADSLLVPHLKNYADTLKINVLGEFGYVEGDGDHSYGRVFELWKIQDEVIGFFKYYEGNIEPVVGLITLGKVTQDSLFIEGTMSEADNKEIFSFKGTVQRNKILGSLGLMQMTEQVELHRNNDGELQAYDRYTEWKQKNIHFLRKFTPVQIK